MLYLLGKTRKTGSLSQAIDKLRNKYDLSKRQANRVLRKFQKMGISPITLQEENDKPLPGLEILLNG